MKSHLTINPEPHEWSGRLEGEWARNDALLDGSSAEWKRRTRRELGLAIDQPILATGHQTLLWHPGILAKYFAVEAAVAWHGYARANLVVDQHADVFGSFDLPLRRADGSLRVRSVELTQPRRDVPMGLHEPFTPVVDEAIRRLLAESAGDERAQIALPSAMEGARRILEYVCRYVHAPNAALQMAAVVGELMERWVQPMTHVTATALGQTTLARALLEEMVRDPQTCARHYNEAVAHFAGARIRPLLVREDYVEAPLWRIRADGTRMRAYDNDIEQWLETGAPLLMPRALFMTALVRMGMCDLFVHGRGGANYDRAMERWIQRWLGATVAPIAEVSADVCLPFPDLDARGADADALRHAWRKRVHDASADSEMSEEKRRMLAKIREAASGSRERREAFYAMHRWLERMRAEHSEEVERARRALTEAERGAANARVAQRRDWAFPLYPMEMLDGLREEFAAAFRVKKLNARAVL